MCRSKNLVTSTKVSYLLPCKKKENTIRACLYTLSIQNYLYSYVRYFEIMGLTNKPLSVYCAESAHTRLKRTIVFSGRKLVFKTKLKIYSFRSLVDTLVKATDHLGKGHLHLKHGVVEVHVLEQLDGGEEEQDCEKGDEVLPGCVDLVETRVLVLDLDQTRELTVYSEVTVDEETDGDVA